MQHFAIIFGTLAFSLGAQSCLRKSGSTSTNITPKKIAIPEKPQDVKAEPGNTEVIISWQASQGASSYIVYWSKRNGFWNDPDYDPKDQNNIVEERVSNKVLQAKHAFLTNDTTYYYVVTAIGEGGESEASDEVSATPKAPVLPTLPPSTPTPSPPPVKSNLSALSPDGSYVLFHSNQCSKINCFYVSTKDQTQAWVPRLFFEDDLSGNLDKLSADISDDGKTIVINSTSKIIVFKKEENETNWEKTQEILHKSTGDSIFIDASGSRFIFSDGENIYASSTAANQFEAPKKIGPGSQYHLSDNGSYVVAVDDKLILYQYESGDWEKADTIESAQHPRLNITGNIIASVTSENKLVVFSKDNSTWQKTTIDDVTCCEHKPTLSADGTTIIINNQFSRKQPDGWTKGLTALDSNLGAVQLSSNGLAMSFERSNRVYVMIYSQDKWQDPQLVDRL